MSTALRDWQVAGSCWIAMQDRVELYDRVRLRFRDECEKPDIVGGQFAVYNPKVRPPLANCAQACNDAVCCGDDCQWRLMVFTVPCPAQNSQPSPVRIINPYGRLQ